MLISRAPLRTRQPDVFVIPKDRLSANPPATDPSSLDPAPEFVVEILSPSEYRRIRLQRLDDYCKVGVLERWIISPEAETIEVLKLSPRGYETKDIYVGSQTAQSTSFPEFKVSVAELFED